MRESVPVRSVARAIDLLLALSKGPMSLGQVSELVELSKATTHRLLASLAHGQLVIQDPATGHYLLGPGCFIVANAVLRGMGGLGVVARPLMDELRETTRETITLHVRAGVQRFCVTELVSPEPVRYTAGVGAASPIHSGSAGKLLLAFSEEDELREILDNLTLQALTDATITDRSELERELRQIRGRGYAQSRGERIVGGAAISAPVFAADGSLLAALSILGPGNRLTKAKLRELRPVIVEAAQGISERLAADEVVEHAEQGVAG